MIEKLKDILIIFKKVYNDYFAIKHKALNAIKEYETKMNTVCKAHYLLDKIYDNLDEVFSLLPIKDDQQCIKQAFSSTLRILRYAAKAEDCYAKEGNLFLGYGLNDIYSNLYSKLEYEHNKIKYLYKEKKYDDVIEQVDKMLKYLDNFYLVYNNH